MTVIPHLRKLPKPLLIACALLLAEYQSIQISRPKDAAETSRAGRVGAVAAAGDRRRADVERLQTERFPVDPRTADTT